MLTLLIILIVSLCIEGYLEQKRIGKKIKDISST
jgi:hypothetical protein